MIITVLTQPTLTLIPIPTLAPAPTPAPIPMVVVRWRSIVVCSPIGRSYPASSAPTSLFYCPLSTSTVPTSVLVTSSATVSSSGPSLPLSYYSRPSTIYSIG